ncbi:hypothetical protein NLI96_g10034 [Meripilus lineatus]|uniref:Fumarylacetoacetase-like C-terminal domain-containing protein n=1 Tax=Meripilus lineatus TaxID=2056292 RepID=A0AAD5Y9N2_9APHY|nr:hypothetical protein NLI96_g10034 [Physisporinus lineatus]
MAAAAFVRQGKKIVAIGRNYVDHVKELQNTVPKEPFFFLKPTTSYLPSGGKVLIPRGILAHYEVELGVVVGKTGRDISQAEAESHIAGYALAVDMTARNLQDEIKKKGLPWSAVKGFDTFTPISSYVPKSSILDASNLNLSLKLVHEAYCRAQEGDLILTGTPSGVGPLAPGDNVECALADPEGKILTTLDFQAVARDGGYNYQPSK